MKRGLFITFEGVDGSGKSTILQFFKEYLLSQQIHFVMTREPGGTPIAEAIRQLVLSHNGQEAMADDTELLLYFASRAQHIARLIEPTLAGGRHVISDRFTDASFAYQSGGRGISEERITILEQWVQKGLQPDLTLLLDVTPEIGLARVQNNRAELDRFEVEKIHFFERVRHHYLQRAHRYAKRFRIIDASQPLEQVKQSVLDLMTFEHWIERLK